MPTPEQKIKKKIKDWIDREGIGYWAAVTGGSYSKPGQPDLILCINGKFVGVEGKVPVSGVQSQHQKNNQEDIEHYGGQYIIARTVEELKNELRRRGFLQDGE